MNLERQKPDFIDEGEPDDGEAIDDEDEEDERDDADEEDMETA